MADFTVSPLRSSTEIAMERAKNMGSGITQAAANTTEQAAATFSKPLKSATEIAMERANNIGANATKTVTSEATQTATNVVDDAAKPGLWQRTKDFFNKFKPGKGTANVADDAAKTGRIAGAADWLTGKATKVGTMGETLTKKSAEYAGKAGTAGSRTLTQTGNLVASKSTGYAGSALEFLGKRSAGAVTGGVAAAAFEVFDEYSEVKQGFKEGRGLAQLGQSTVEVAGTGVGAGLGVAAGMAIGALGGPLGIIAGGLIGGWLGEKFGNKIGDNVGTAVFGENKAARLERTQKDMSDLGLVQQAPTQIGFTGNPAMANPFPANNNNQYLAALLANDPQFMQELMAKGLL